MNFLQALFHPKSLFKSPNPRNTLLFIIPTNGKYFFTFYVPLEPLSILLALKNEEACENSIIQQENSAY